MHLKVHNKITSTSIGKLTEYCEHVSLEREKIAKPSLVYLIQQIMSNI